MKKYLVMLILALTTVMLAACGKPDTGSAGGSSDKTSEEAAGDGSSEEAAEEGLDLSTLKVLQDAFDVADEEGIQYEFGENEFIYAFKSGGQDYRVIAEMTKDLYEKANEIPFEDEDHDAKLKELVGQQKITSTENLTENQPTQEELDKLVGKTGGDLFDDHWVYWSYDLDAMELGMNHGAYTFTVAFEYDGEPMKNSDDFDPYEKFRDLKVKSVTYDGIGDATMVE